MKNKYIELEISNMGLPKELISKLKNANINKIKDIWILSRIDLRNIGFTNEDINLMIIELQLLGLDLNKKIY